MPELPEVETTRCGITPHVKGQKISQVTIRHFQLRWPIQDDLASVLQLQTIHSIERRAKYLLFKCDSGTLIIHLGMSGSLQIVSESDPIAKHAHLDIRCGNDLILRFTDPRRFGAVLWTSEPIEQHTLLKHLGPEPLSDDFSADYLYKITRNRRTTIKTFIMNGQHVVGVGNIYANEALFLAGIHPKTLAGKLSKKKSECLVPVIKNVLKKAIEAGGTTLKDFRNSDGKPGYFAQQLHVYGREGEACTQCGTAISHYKEAQRATYFCPECQPR
ncbi:MAG: bifunctional DNA-formamidopyrimidine glycosylase/DNA-(apurinic or apyrimidinic site) lyase [Gammaproteobacteria bacterium]|nr:bifunctional DNA-formamidopyrimidine glycosylase/DNA-(apurinic or apyrimidinic site) lyase [Gammaproteobacteria bacterium]